MNRCVVALAVLALFPGAAIAQTVFFDDFDGNALLPHWYQPPASHWQYNVSNSMLNVTGLLVPSNPKSPGNYTEIAALFAPQTDFQMDVWMGWEAGDDPHRLTIHVGGPFGGSPIIASMGYANDGVPIIQATATSQSAFMPAPPPGIHHFTISRTAAQFNFYFNGSPFASFHDNFGTPAAAVWFDFVGPYPGALGAFHIDQIVVVPTPGSLILFLAVPFLGTRRR